MMTLRQPHPTLRLALGLVVILALVFSAFGHRKALSSEDMAVESYVLAGGNITDICGDDPDKAALFHACPVCCLTALAEVPGLQLSFVTQERSYVLRVIVPQLRRALRAPRDPAHGPQAPPTLLI